MRDSIWACAFTSLCVWFLYEVAVAVIACIVFVRRYAKRHGRGK